ncbi:MAG: hypothetical protein M1829_000850 [Trizodia sp. TS-e1964]|nr:MAG: hypothetical protein M1829_000850 [Trizodia sp. TS-e1964]
MPKAAKPRGATSRASPLSAAESNAAQRKEAPKKGSAAKVAAEPKPKATAPAESYLFLVHMSDISEPNIDRLLSVPSHFTFSQMHEVLQVAFGWAGCHMHQFRLAEMLQEGDTPNFLGEGKIVRYFVGNDAGIPYDNNEDPKTEMSDKYTLKDVYFGEEFGQKVGVTYEYDMGDSWEHEMIFMGVADPRLRQGMIIPPEFQAVCIGGEGHCYAEDAGGVPGWENLKEQFKKRGDKEGLKDWYKTVCGNGDPKGLDPYKWDILTVNDGLAKIK